MSEVTLKAPAIHCDGCLYSIKGALRRETGIVDVDGDGNERTVTIKFDETQTSVETIREAMERIGYETVEA